MKKRKGICTGVWRKAKLGLWVGLGTLIFTFSIPSVLADEAIVYSVYKGVDLGESPEESQKDYFVNLGTNHGVKEGSVLEVSRRTPTYDLATEKLYKDLIYPFATLRVIHAERDASIARIEKMYPYAQTPILTPRAVIVGDLVRSAK